MGGIEAQIYRSVLIPPATFGIPNNLFLFLLISGMSMVFSLGQVWFLIPIAVFMILGRIISNKDIFNIEIILRLIKLPEVLD